MHPRRRRRHLGAFHERPGGHLLNDRLSVSRRIIVRSGAKKRCTAAVLVIALPTLRASRRVRNRLGLTSTPRSDVRLPAKPGLISSALYIDSRPMLLFLPGINSPLYTRIVRRNVIGSRPDAMNVTDVIILLTFVISSDDIVPEEVFETLVAGSTWMGCGTIPWRWTSAIRLDEARRIKRSRRYNIELPIPP
ncbi:Uncharacterized protein DBV15_03174, partial [Temnothorax longispinosus]